MKQTPTEKQWHSLPKEGKEILTDFILERDLSFQTVVREYPWEFMYIGVMMEYLGDDWVMCINSIRKPDFSSGINFPKNNEVCDRLWEAVLKKVKATLLLKKQSEKTKWIKELK